MNQSTVTAAKSHTAFEMNGLKAQRKILTDSLEALEKGHPKPERVAAANARLDTFDSQHPAVRNWRG